MNRTILLVEDELDMAEVTHTRLGKNGYEVIVVPSGEEALAILKDQTPDLILLDLLLPGMQGEDVCKQIKCEEKIKKIPIILFTASASNLPKLIQQVGADDYIMKPFDPEELLKKIKGFLGQATPNP